MVLLRFEFDVLTCVDKEKNDAEDFGALASAFPGSGVLVPGFDMKVRMRRRN